MESVAELLQLEGCEFVGWRAEGELAVCLARWTARLACCPACGSGELHSHGWRERRLWHLPQGWRRFDVAVSFQRWRCQGCGKVHTPPLPLAAPRARLTEALRRFAGELLARLRLAVEPVRRWLGLGWQTLRRCLPPPPAPLDRATPAELEHLCLDEVFFREPRRYLTVLSTASGLVLGVAPGRGERPSRQLLEALPADTRAAVETLASDFNAGQIKAAQACLPQALVCADHFHLARLTRRMLRATPAAQLPRARRAAHALRELLHDRQPAALLPWLERWSGATGPLGTLVETVDRSQVEIENYLATGRSTGPAEALNRSIAFLRRAACGYTSLRNFTHRILLLNSSSHQER